MPDTLDFDGFVALLRQRIGDADAIKPGELHPFKVLMADYADVTPDQWYWDALDELKAWGHVHPASTVINGGDACARLSADGRAYLREYGRE
jgi:hypothetical protein